MTERTVLKWTEEKAKGGGSDHVAGQFVISPDDNRGGWNVYIGHPNTPTLDEAKACAQRIQDAIDGYDRLEEAIAKIETYRQSVEAEIADDDEELARLGELAALRRALDLLRETR